LGDEHVPPAYDLEEDIRSGILLARLANYFSPESVQLDKVFDLDSSRLRDQGLQYRHTDNILKWRRACESVGVMSILLPEPADTYAGKNIRTIFAIIALASRLSSMGKAPQIRDQSDFVLTDADYEVLRDRIAAASETEGIDWDVIQRDRQKFEILRAEQIIADTSDHSLASLRHLCKALDLSHTLYDADFLLEAQKMRLNKLMETSEWMRGGLNELENNIGLLTKNFHPAKKGVSNQASPSAKPPCDEVFNDTVTSSSVTEGFQRLVHADRQLSSASHPHEDCIQPDDLLVAKACLLMLLKEKVRGESVKEVASNKSFIAFDSKTHAKLEEVQKLLDSELKKLVEMQQLSADGKFNELLASVFWDIRNEKERDRVRAERKDYLDNMIERSKASATQVISQIANVRHSTCG